MNINIKCWNLVLVTAGMAFSAGALEAQSIEDFVVSEDAARNIKTREEISLDTARRIAEHCHEQATARDLGTSIFVLNPEKIVMDTMPPEGHGIHHYFFWILALDAESDLEPGLSMEELLRKIEPSVIAMNRLVGTYSRE